MILLAVVVLDVLDRGMRAVDKMISLIPEKEVPEFLREDYRPMQKRGRPRKRY